MSHFQQQINQGWWKTLTDRKEIESATDATIGGGSSQQN
jgi:hypothetical protein